MNFVLTETTVGLASLSPRVFLIVIYFGCSLFFDDELQMLASWLKWGHVGPLQKVVTLVLCF